MDVAQALAAARALGVDRLDAQWLLGHHLQQSRAWLLAHDEHILLEAIAQTFLAQLAERAAGVPLAYVVGEREFCGMRLHVDPTVLIPRPETELLVEWALQVLPSAPAPTVLDLGTGSGAIALAVATRSPGAQVTATDASASALAVARDNAQRLGLAVAFAEGSWWAPLTGRRFGLILSNPPYVAENDAHLAALAHEPRSALTAGANGLDDLRVIVAGATSHLLPGAWLLLEHGHDQGPAVRALLTAAGLRDTETRNDLAGLPRCTGARMPGSGEAIGQDLTPEARG